MFKISYDKPVFATSSSPMVPPNLNVENKNACQVKKEFDYLSHVLKLMKSVKELLIIEGAFIGVEFTDECRNGRDINVTVVEAVLQCLQMTMDDEFCVETESKLTEAGVKVMVNAKVDDILGDNSVTSVKLAGGMNLKYIWSFLVLLLFLILNLPKSRSLSLDSEVLLK